MQLGGELARLDDVIGTHVSAEVAFVFDWESWWALELSSKPSQDLLLLDQVALWYRPLWQRNVAVDFVHPEADLSRYLLVIVPNLYLVSDAGAANVVRFADGGGTLAVSFFSGIADERDHVRLGGYPAPFRRTLGIVVPEVWPHAVGETGQITLDGYSCDLWSDWLELESADAVGAYADGWLTGRAAVTRRGSAWYVGTRSTPRAMDVLIANLAAESGVAAPLETPAEVEVVRREGAGRSFLFLPNHGADQASVELDAAYQDVLSSARRTDTVTLERSVSRCCKDRDGARRDCVMPVESGHRAEENVDMCQTLELLSRQIDVNHFAQRPLADSGLLYRESPVVKL